MTMSVFKKLNHVVVISATVTLASSPIQNLLQFLYLQSRPFSSSSSLSSIKSIEKSLKKRSFTVDYLINSCGLTPKRAISASKLLKFIVPYKPDSVLTFLKNHGFSQTQISKVVNYIPQVLICNPEKSLLPKLEFLKSKGYSEADVTVIISKLPTILVRSLENQLIPSSDFLSNFLQSDDLNDYKRCIGFLMFDLEKHGISNINILKEAGVPISNIQYLLANHPRAFMTASYKFRRIVDEVKIMEFDPLRLKFLIAVKVKSSMAKVTWDRKVEVYKKWGWSEKEITDAFQYFPACMALSANKINSIMGFWVDEMGWKPSVLANIPTIMSMSLEKRIKPRCNVYRALLFKGFKKPCGISLSTWFTINESSFLDKIRNRHEEEAPELLKLYNEKSNPDK